jgi:hypothetical protein
MSKLEYVDCARPITEVHKHIAELENKGYKFKGQIDWELYFELNESEVDHNA